MIFVYFSTSSMIQWSGALYANEVRAIHLFDYNRRCFDSFVLLLDHSKLQIWH